MPYEPGTAVPGYTVYGSRVKTPWSFLFFLFLFFQSVSDLYHDLQPEALDVEQWFLDRWIRRTEYFIPPSIHSFDIFAP